MTFKFGGNGSAQVTLAGKTGNRPITRPSTLAATASGMRESSIQDGPERGSSQDFYNLIESELTDRNDLTHIRFGDRRPQPMPRGHACAGPCRSATAFRRDVAPSTFGKSLRVNPERRHGLGPGQASRSRIPHSQHPRRPARREWRGHRSRLPHGTLGSGAAGGGSGAGIEGAACRALCRRLHGPLRWTHSGHHRHVGLPSLPQRCRHRAASSHPFTAHRQRCHRHCYL